MSKKVALVGMATTSRDDAPWDDESWEIWTLNESPSKRFGYVKRVTRHFQLHPKWNCSRKGNQNDPEHYQWLKVQKFPIYMQAAWKEYPTAVQYPIKDIFDHFKIAENTEGHWFKAKSHWREFDSTFPYMLALALYEGFDEISIYGFEMGSETEYAYQRPNVHLWMGIARGLYLATGKPKIIIPDDCKLLGWDTKLYAYEMIKGINPMEIEIDRNKFGNTAAQLSAEVARIEGAQNELEAQLSGLQMAFGKRAEEVKDKKRTDPKLKQKRLDELQGQYDKQAAPLIQRLKFLEQQRAEKELVKARFEGGHLAAKNWLARYNSQGRPGGLST